MARSQVVLAILTVPLVMALLSSVSPDGAGSVAAAGTVNELARLRLTPATRIRRIEEGKATLRLSISGQRGTSFQTFSEVEGNGLFKNRLYAMWLESPDTGQESNAILLAIDQAGEKCEFDPETGRRFNCEKIAKFRSRLTEAPFRVTTLVGLTINIREHLSGRDRESQLLVATGTVTERDLR